MTRPRMVLIGVVVAAAVVSVVAPVSGRRVEPQTPQAVFRTNTDLVTVPVFVKGSDGKIGSLSAQDFALTDTGVPQRIEMVDGESIPADVTVLMETGSAIEDYRKGVNEQVRRIAAMMRPTDRIEVLGIDDYVHVLVPFGPPTRSLEVGTFTGGGMMSVNDALVAALLREPSPDRRHLIIALTDTIDTMSTATMATVRDVARQSSSTLVVAWITLSQDGDPSPGVPWATASERLDRHIKAPVTLGARGLLGHPDPARPTARTVPARQQWTPHYDPPKGRRWEAFDVLREAAALTGGSVHPPGVFVDRNASTIFDKIYAEFRQNFILRYLPTGVTRDGWHDVTVTIPRTPGAEIRARRGYLVESAAPASTPTPGTRAMTTLDALIEAAGTSDLPAMRAAIATADSPERLTTLIADFQKAGNVRPASPRREFIAALMLADAAISASSEPLRADALGLLRRYRALVRSPLGPDAFDDEWMASAATIADAPLSILGSDRRTDMNRHLTRLVELARPAK